jgi:polyisoprenoid-binding protein YceI
MQAQISPARYVIDAPSSKFTVQAFAGGLLSALGHNPTLALRDISGEAHLNFSALESSSLRLSLKAASIAVQDDIKDKDRQEMEQTMHTEVLESAKYPEIVFQSSRVSGKKTGDNRYHATISGTLNLHGVSGSQSVDADLTVDGGTLRATGEFAVKQTAYGMKLVSAVAGTLKVKDELKFVFDIVAKA